MKIGWFTLSAIKYFYDVIFYFLDRHFKENWICGEIIVFIFLNEQERWIVINEIQGERWKTWNYSVSLFSVLVRTNLGIRSLKNNIGDIEMTLEGPSSFFLSFYCTKMGMWRITSVRWNLELASCALTRHIISCYMPPWLSENYFKRNLRTTFL